MASNRNALLLRGLSEQAEALSCVTSGNSLPVLLRPLASRRKVTGVEFRPLLVDAMLTTHPGGFRCILNSRGRDAGQLKLQYESEAPGSLLEPRMRFSVAHELAHTLFYDLSGGAPRVSKEFRSGGGRTELENLERNCNKLAAIVLLPKPLLKRALQLSLSIHPGHLLNLAKAAGVSIEVLVRRLNEQGDLLLDPYFRGCIVLARQSLIETKIVAVAKPPGISMAAELLLLRPGEQWQLHSADGSLIELGKLPQQSEQTLSGGTARRTRLQYRVARAEVWQSGSEAVHLLTFEEMDSL